MSSCFFREGSNIKGLKRGRADRGFTLLELILVVVIIGLIAAIAIPQLSLAKNRAYVATMISDLHTLATSQESHYYDNSVYAGTLPLLAFQRFQASAMVTVTITEATSAGWSATADHQLSNVQCALFVGGAAPVGAATIEGAIACA